MGRYASTTLAAFVAALVFGPTHAVAASSSSWYWSSSCRSICAGAAPGTVLPEPGVKNACGHQAHCICKIKVLPPPTPCSVPEAERLRRLRAAARAAANREALRDAPRQKQAEKKKREAATTCDQCYTRLMTALNNAVRFSSRASYGVREHVVGALAGWEECSKRTANTCPVPGVAKSVRGACMNSDDPACVSRILDGCRAYEAGCR